MRKPLTKYMHAGRANTGSLEVREGGRGQIDMRKKIPEKVFELHDEHPTSTSYRNYLK